MELLAWRGAAAAPASPPQSPHGGLRVLGVAGNGLGDAAVALLAEGLRRSAALEVLGLARNAIGDHGCALLSEALREQRAMLKAEASEPAGAGADGDVGAEAKDLGLAGGCPRRPSGLAELDLSENPLGDAGLEALAEAACEVPRLDAPAGPWGLARLAVAGHRGTSRGVAALRQAAGARLGLLDLLVKAILAAEPPASGGGAPPTLLRVDLLGEPSAEEVRAENNLFRHWEEHFGVPAADDTAPADISLDEALRLMVGEGEETPQDIKEVSMVHLPNGEDPEMVEAVPQRDTWWPELPVFGADEPDALDSFWENDEPATEQIKRLSTAGLDSFPL
eukprot:TRINITY_DN72398_c0_g1_i1.p1 TRINITY_DN72398_c0_g1~~TRINITY_DN72398_c0_g1_i1.p1  ORF type:complete len:336 (-),score=101.98 TRINITY_DN72398_c0_g1_i1:254-1261(-)